LIFQQVAGDGRDARIPLVPPQFDPAADEVDVVVLLGAVLRPLRIEGELLALLLRAGDGDEVATRAAAFNDLVRDPVVVELEVPPGRLEG
jgi:hypothetical protein